MAGSASVCKPQVRHWRRFRLPVAIALLVLAVLLLWYVFLGFGSSGADDAAQAGLAYAQQHTVWITGPTVHSTHLVKLGQLRAALAANAPRSLREHVNVADLVRRFGAGRTVALVMLAGIYNTLPPDEGVIVHGGMVEVVDVKTNRVLLLTY